MSKDAYSPGMCDTAFVSDYSNQDGTFTCGPNVAGFRVCKANANNLVTCVRSLEGKEAAQFQLDKELPYYGETKRKWYRPMIVRLTNGATCTPLTRDQEQHYQNRHGWYGCSDGATLLQDERTQKYFNQSQPTWTVEHAMHADAPTRVGVKSVEYVKF